MRSREVGHNGSVTRTTDANLLPAELTAAIERGELSTEVDVGALSELLLEDKIHGTVTVDYKDGAFTFDSPADKDKQEQPAAPAAD